MFLLGEQEQVLAGMVLLLMPILTKASELQHKLMTCPVSRAVGHVTTLLQQAYTLARQNIWHAKA